MSGGYITIARASDPRVDYGLGFHVKHLRDLPLVIVDFLIGVKQQHGFPLRLVMPCGREIMFPSMEEFPLEDIKCPCGNVEHVPIRFFVEPWKDLDLRN
jgi:hypothetical protein